MYNKLNTLHKHKTPKKKKKKVIYAKVKKGTFSK